MGDPYTSVTVANYNANPPSDDGSTVPSNEITWAKHKTKLADPLKTAIESIDTNVGSAVDKLAGGVTAVNDDYTILAGDQGKSIVQSVASKAITTPAAATVTSPFRCRVVNNSSGDLTLDGNASETIDGALTLTIPAGRGVILETDGTNWFTAGRNWLDTNYVIRPVAGGYKNLVVQPSSATAVDVTADAITLENSAGESYRASSVSLLSGTLAITGSGANGLDTGAEGADTWYSVWVIYDSTNDTVAGLLSISATAPTLPGTYDYKARVGWVRNDNSSDLYRTIQKGNRAQYIVGTNPTAVIPMDTGSSAAWTAIATGAFVPSTAHIIHAAARFEVDDDQTKFIMVAPNNSYATSQGASTNTAPVIMNVNRTDDGSVFDTTIPFSFLLETTNIYWGTDEAAAAINVLGWEDNI